MARPALVSIPLEVRQAIYKHLIPDIVEVDCCHCENYGPTSTEPNFSAESFQSQQATDVRNAILRPRHQRTALLLTNRQIHTEASDVQCSAITVTVCSVMCLLIWVQDSTAEERTEIRVIKAGGMSRRVMPGGYKPEFPVAKALGKYFGNAHVVSSRYTGNGEKAPGQTEDESLYEVELAVSNACK